MRIRELMTTFLTDAYRAGRMLAVAAIPVALLGTHVWYQTRITQLGYEISEETDRHEKLVDERRKLDIQVTLEGRDGRVAERARERFELERVEPQQVISIDRRATEPDESLDQTEHAALEQGGGE